MTKRKNIEITLGLIIIGLFALSAYLLIGNQNDKAIKRAADVFQEQYGSGVPENVIKRVDPDEIMSLYYQSTDNVVHAFIYIDGVWGEIARIK